jgi:hypothetical protein
MDVDHMVEQAAFQEAMRAEKEVPMIGRRRMEDERGVLPTCFICSKTVSREKFRSCA